MGESEHMAGKGHGVEARILASARDLFAEKGFFACSTREVASKAGTSESGMFRYFPSKYHLLMAVYNDCWGEVNAHIEAALSHCSGDPGRRILAIVKTVWELYSAKPLLATFIIINTGNTDTLLVEKTNHAIISDQNLKYIERIEGLCADCKSKNYVDSTISIRALCEGVLGITEGILLGWYLADKTEARYPHKIGISEGLNLVSHLIYSGKKCRPEDWEGI